MTGIQHKALSFIRSNPGGDEEDLAEELGVPLGRAKDIVDELLEQGEIERAEVGMMEDDQEDIEAEDG